MKVSQLRYVIFYSVLVFGCTNNQQPCFPPVPYDQVTGITWINYTKTLRWDSIRSATSYTAKITSGAVGSGISFTTSNARVSDFFTAFGVAGIPGNFEVQIQPNYHCGSGQPSSTDFNYCNYDLSVPTGISWDDSHLMLSWTPVPNAFDYMVQIKFPPNGEIRGIEEHATNLPQLFDLLSIPGAKGNYSVTITPNYECGTGPSSSFSFVH